MKCYQIFLDLKFVIVIKFCIALLNLTDAVLIAADRNIIFALALTFQLPIFLE